MYKRQTIKDRPSGTSYLLIEKKGHPHPSNANYVLAHVLVVEDVLKRYIKKTEVIHHIDGNGLNNANTNLVVCENQSYHMLLHKRLSALRSCGNANWRKCKHCKKYDDPNRLKKARNGKKGYFIHYHQECHKHHMEKIKKKTIAKPKPLK